MRSWLHLLGAAAYGGASMQLHRTPCMARLSSACGVQYTTLRRLAARTRGHSTHHAAISGHDAAQYSDVECTGAPCDLAGAAECVLSGGQNVAKTRVDVCRVFSSHVQTLQCVSLCTVHCRQLSPVAVYSCAVSRSCCGSRWFFVGGFPQCLRHNLLTI